MSSQPVQPVRPRRASLVAARGLPMLLALAAGLAGASAAAQVAGAPETYPVIRDGSDAPRPARPAAGTRDAVAVLIDRAKVIRLPDRTQTVIVGNPLIADVTLQRSGAAVLTGKSYGVTNLIALDAAGSMLAESLVSVQAPTEALVTVQRGLERETYSCNPNCQRSLLLGDSRDYFAEVGNQAERRNALATQR